MSTQALDFGAPLLPLSQDPDYPLVLRELAELVQGELESLDVEPTRAAAMAETVAEHVRERYGGQPIYWPKGHTMRARRRREAMWADFTGDNYVALSHKYGLSLQAAYRAIAIARRESTQRVQSDLFTDAAVPR